MRACTWVSNLHGNAALQQYPVYSTGSTLALLGKLYPYTSNLAPMRLFALYISTCPFILYQAFLSIPCTATSERRS